MQSKSKASKIKSALEAARAQLRASNGNQSVGDLVWSDPVSGWTHDAVKVREAFTAAGLDPDVYLPAIPDYGTAYSRAVLAVRTHIQGRGYTLLAAGYGPNGESRYSVMQVERNGTVATADRACVQCPKDGTAPFVERSSDDPQADDIAALIVQASKERYGKYTSDDVRTAFVTVLAHYQAQSTRTCQPHTHFWVPAGGTAAVRAMGAVLESLGWGVVQSFEGAAGAGNVETATRIVNQGLDADLASFQDAVNKFLGAAGAVNANGKERDRSAATQRKINEGEALREKADMYRAILGMGVDSVDEAVQGIEAVILEAMQS